MAEITCPKCGLAQDSGTECVRCGIVFARYTATEATPEVIESPPAETLATDPAAPSRFRQFYRVFRWGMLAMLILVAALILRRPAPPVVDVDLEADQHLQSRLVELRESVQRGRAHTLRLPEAELNSWLTQNLELAPTAAVDPSAETEVAVEEVQSAMRDIRIDLSGDRLLAYVVFDFHGQDLALTLEGRIEVRDGYLRLQPIGGKLGSLPLPQIVLERAVQRLFDSPENRQKFHLPDRIEDIRVENGELRVSFLGRR